jgi:hypothetical protein
MAHRIVKIDRSLGHPPGGDEARIPKFVDYYLTLLVRCGPGVLEAEPGLGEDPVSWRHRSFVREDGLISCSAGGEWRVVDLLPRGMFRPVLARLGFALTSDEDPYGGHGLFRIHFADEPEPREFLFRAFLSNEPSVGFWVRLYWYGPRLDWPTGKTSA